MINEKLVRVTLGVSAPFNFMAACLVVMPGSPIGQIMGLPAIVPIVYSAILGFLIFLFGCVYAWMALQETINRPLLAIATLGKAGVVCIVMGLWLSGQAAGQLAFLTVGDLVFALIWGSWILRARPAPGMPS